jgi:hypothetical protein
VLRDAGCSVSNYKYAQLRIQSQTSKPKRSTSQVSALEHRQKFAEQLNRGWRGLIDVAANGGLIQAR